ncbi:MAG: DUF11 domain-containing protein [Clostridia bacterium]|nr:DUF11 domain-containing protein [Clostridia bacterium]
MATADLSVSKTVSPNPAGIGQPINYTIAVLNNSSETVSDVTVEDTIPTGMYLNGVSVEQGTYCYEDGTITWNVGTLSPGGTATMTVTVISPSAGTFGNTANVYFDNEEDEDPNPDNNSSNAEVTVNPAVDLIILKESCPAEPIAGETLEYFITVYNNGPSAANNVEVTDNIPTGVDIESVTSDKGTCQITGNTVNCSLNTLDINERWNIRIEVTPNTEGVIENTAQVTSDEPDINPENNSDSITTTIGPSADLSIEKEASPQEVVLGNTLTYTLLVTNLGPSVATNVTLTDNLPPNITVSSIAPSQGSCTQLGDVITCSLGNIPNNNSATVVIKATPNEPGLIKNFTSVSSSSADPNLSNNNSTACAYVKKSLSTDISVSKSHTPEPVAVCTPVLYTITIKNIGSTSATGIILTDQIPPSLKVLSVSSSQGRCCICDDKECHEPHKLHNKNEAKNCMNQVGCISDHCQGNSEIICQIGSLPTNGSAIVKICAIPKLVGTITNTAIVTSNEEDLDPSNNEATDTLTVITFRELIEFLVNYINGLIASGKVKAENGNILIQYLNKALKTLCYKDTCEALGKLSSFIVKVEKYIENGIIPEEEGLYLIKTIQPVKKFLECSDDCTPCGECQYDMCTGDDLNE